MTVLNLRAIANAALAEDAAPNRGGEPPRSPSNPVGVALSASLSDPTRPYSTLNDTTSPVPAADSFLSLYDHDERFHPLGFLGGRCLYRAKQSLADPADDLSSDRSPSGYSPASSPNPDGQIAFDQSPRDLRRTINRSNYPKSVREQMLSVLKAYTERGKSYKKGFLKAPMDLGKNSNLNADDWLFARTDAFRDGSFGDWLNLLRKNRSENTPPVGIQRTGIPFTKPDGKLINQALEWIRKRGDEVFDTEVGMLRFDEKSVKNSLEHYPFTPAKYDALFSIPNGFPNAVYLGTLDDFDGNTITNHYFAYPAVYDEERQIVFCRARENADRSALYIHDIFLEDDIKNEAPVLPPDITALKAEIAQGVYRGPSLYNSILKLVYGVNPQNVSKNVDENGEPSKSAIESYRQSLFSTPDGQTAFGQSPAPFNPAAFLNYLAGKDRKED